MREERQVALAVDIGGTKIKAGVIESGGKLLDIIRLDTPANAENLINRILLVITELLHRNELGLANIQGVGITIAAFITAGGEITATAHLPAELVGMNLNERLQKHIPASIYYALDAPTPTLGEYYYGAGRGVEDLVYITVSTGIGAGIIAGGTYFTGGLGWAGGIGHCIIDESSPRICEACGNHGCLETFAARQGIIQTALEKIELYPHSHIISLVQDDLARITPEIVAAAANLGDRAANEVFHQAGHALGIGLTHLVDIISPVRIVVGGGIARAGELLLAPARKFVQQHAFPPVTRDVEIVQAGLDDLSSMYGAAAMVFYDLRIN